MNETVLALLVLGGLGALVVAAFWYGIEGVGWIFEILGRKGRVVEARNQAILNARAASARVLLIDAEIETTFPDDAVFRGGTGDMVRPGTLNILQAMVALLVSRGATASEPVMRDDYGWELNLRYQGRGYWLLTQEIDFCLLQTKQTGPGKDPLTSPDTDYARFLTLLHDLMKADPRFVAVGWYPAGGFHSVPARDHPLAAFGAGGAG